MTAPAAAASGVRRLDSLTGLRWWAAFGVFVYHMSNLAPLKTEVLQHWGNYGVTFFFVLSGFVLSWSARPATTRPSTFWWRRFARIYPAHLVALLVAIPVFYSFAPDPADWWVKPFDLGVVLLSVVLLQGWSADPIVRFSGNPAAWTLTCEAFFYALHPLLNRSLRRLRTRGALIVSVGVVLLAIVYRAVLVIAPGLLPPIPLPVTRLLEFVIGMTVAQAFLSGWVPRLKPLWIYLAGIVVILIFTYGSRVVGDDPAFAVVRRFSPEVVLVVCALMIAAVAARDLRGEPSLLRSRALVWLGDLSYSFYLVHATIMYLLLDAVSVQQLGWLNLAWYALVLVLAIGAAAALHYLVEKPFERHLRAWWDRRVGPPHASSERYSPGDTPATSPRGTTG